MMKFVKCEQAPSVSTLAVQNSETPEISVPRVQNTKIPRRTTTVKKLGRSTTVKKWVPTVSGDGHVQGVENPLREKNERKEGWFFKDGLGIFVTAPMAGYVKARDYMVPSFDKSLKERDEKDFTSKSLTWWEGRYEKSNAPDAPSDYSDNTAKSRSNRGERLDARHFSSNCAIELELFKVCLKDRNHTGNKCLDLQSDFRKCQKSVHLAEQK
jgi:hypothetical protein